MAVAVGMRMAVAAMGAGDQVGVAQRSNGSTATLLRRRIDAMHL